MLQSGFNTDRKKIQTQTCGIFRADGSTTSKSVIGPQGPIGPTGIPGISGYATNTGATGPTGFTGPRGVPGYATHTGATGYTGPIGTGPTGWTGNTGWTGPAGINGVTGWTGPAGINGVTGNTGWTGPAGTNGVTGNTGWTGPAGINGVTGTTGWTGPTGPEGQTGNTGPTGWTGPAGTNGPTGWTGPVGPMPNMQPVTNSVYQSTGEIIIDSATSNTSANATQILSFTLPSAGTWDIFYFTRVQGTSTFAGEFGLYNSNGTLISNSEILCYYNTTVANQAATGSGRKIITTTASETYYLKAWASAGSFKSTNDSNGRSGVVYVQLTGGYIGDTGPTGQIGPTGMTGFTGSTGALGTGPTGFTGNTGSTGTTGPTGPIGPTGVSSYAGTSYRDTTTLSYVQNNGDTFFTAALSGDINTSIQNYNELGSMLNVPNVTFTYMAIIYAFVGSPASSQLYFGVIDMSDNIVQSTTLPSSSSTNINNPSTLEFTFPTPITTNTLRCLRIAIFGGNVGGTNKVLIRTVVLGFG